MVGLIWGTCTVAGSLACRDDVAVPNLTSHRQSPVLVALGNEIRRRRTELRIPQEDLAYMAGIERSHLGRIERGDNNVTLINLSKIASALGVSGAELLQSAGL
jgi:DNA-binding XRE family transcriptional regulator